MNGEVITYLPSLTMSQPNDDIPFGTSCTVGGFDLKHIAEWEPWGLEQGVKDAMVGGTSQPLIDIQPMAGTIG
jgi:hypothetical protein